MFKNAKIVSVGADANDYHAQTAERGTKEFVISSSSLRAVFAKSPSAWFKGWTLAESESLEYGSLLDVLVLTPEQFERQYILQPENYESASLECPTCKSVGKGKKCATCKVERVESIVSKPWSNNSDTCAAWIETQAKAGRTVVDQFELDKAIAAKKRLMDDEEISAFIAGCDRQMWIEAEWHDAATGLIIPVKCLIDLAGKAGTPFAAMLGDLKSTKDASNIGWARWGRRVGYDLQAAWNFDLFKAAGREAASFHFVLSENFLPYEVGRRICTQDESDPEMDERSSLVSGRRQYRRMMADYCQFLKSGKWPGYDDTDEASASGWTPFLTDPYEENRRMFAPKFVTAPAAPEETVEENPDLIP